MQDLYQSSKPEVLLHKERIEHETTKMALVKDYDYEILYHPGKANRVVDALSRKSSAALMLTSEMSQPLQKEILDFEIELILG